MFFNNLIFKFGIDCKNYHNFVINNVKKDPTYLYKIKKIPSSLIYKLIDLDPWLIFYFLDKLKTYHYRYAIYKDDCIIKDSINIVNYDLKVTAIRIDYSFIRYINNPCRCLIKISIQCNPLSIYYINGKIDEDLVINALIIEPDVFDYIVIKSNTIIYLAYLLGKDVDMWRID